MTNSDRLQEIRERAENAATVSQNGKVIAVAHAHITWDDLLLLLRIVTEQQNEIAWLRTWIFRLQDPEVAAHKIHQLTEEPMTIEQVKEFLGIDPGSAFGTPGTAD